MLLCRIATQLMGPSENAKSPFQKLWKMSRWWEYNIKPSVEPFQAQGPGWLHKSQALKLVLFFGLPNSLLYDKNLLRF